MKTKLLSLLIIFSLVACKETEVKEPVIVKLSHEQIYWLQKNVNTFKTEEPISNSEDLKFLKEMIGDATIVSLGEGTHGTHEFFKMKHRITKYLSEEMGFTVFAIEANMPEAQLVNEYILTGKGNAKEALAGLYFWTWNTQEVLDMIEWMREYNASQKGRIEFWGFDAQYPNVAVKNTLDFLQKYDPAYFKTAKENYQKTISFGEGLAKMKSTRDNLNIETYFNDAEEVYDHLTENSDKYSEISGRDSTEWIIQNSKIAMQSLEVKMKRYSSRDKSMADNVEWIINHKPKDTKIVLWAHNGHVSKKFPSYKSMGNYLYEKYGEKMIVFGFGFDEGKYTAVGKNGLGTYTTSDSRPGTLEWIFHKTGKERAILDLRKINDSPISFLLTNDIGFRSIGAMAMNDAFRQVRIADEFDAIIYFNKTTPTNCFGMTRK